MDTDKIKPNELTTASISGIAHTRARFADTFRPTQDFTVVAPKLAFHVWPTELGGSCEDGQARGAAGITWPACNRW